MERYYDAVGFTILVAAKGLSFPAFEVGLNAFPVLMLAALRFDLAAMIIFVYLIFAGRQVKPRTHGDFIAISAGGLIIFTVSTGLWSIGQELTTSTLSGLMSSLVPIITAGFSWLLIPEDRLSPLGVIGLGVGFVGALLILLPGTQVILSPEILGKSLLFLGAAAAAVGAVIIRWAKPSMPAAGQTAWSFLIGAVFLHGSSFLFENPVADSTFTPSGIFAVLFLGIVVSAIGRGMFFWLLGRRSAIEISISSYLAPIIAATTGWWLFGDDVSLTMAVGFIVVLGGFSLMKRDAFMEEFSQLKSSI